MLSKMKWKNWIKNSVGFSFQKNKVDADVGLAACKSISKRKEIYSASKFRILRLSETNPLRTMENDILIFRIYFWRSSMFC